MRFESLNQFTRGENQIYLKTYSSPEIRVIGEVVCKFTINYDISFHVLQKSKVYVYDIFLLFGFVGQPEIIYFFICRTILSPFNVGVKLTLSGFS